MLEKHISEGRQVKTRRRPRSVEFALAFHIGTQGDDCLLCQNERLRVKPMFCGPSTELGHAGSLAIGYTFMEAGTALNSSFAIPYLASVKLPSVTPSVALSVVVQVVLYVALAIALTVAQTIAVRIALPVAVPAACRIAFPVALSAALPVALPVTLTFAV